MLDQLQAAARETEEQAGAAGVFLRLVQPDRNWRQMRRGPTDEQQVYLTAALLGCLPCVHLRWSGPQPVVASLPLRRLDCRRCAQALRAPPTDDGDRCDVCGDRGISWFTPFLVAVGPTLIGGDACPRCARVLNIAGAAA